MPRFGSARQEGSTWKGIFIRATGGSDVRSIAGGRVVFAESLAAAMVGIALLWLLVFSIYAWRGLDEAGREAHKFAWFWGGATGLVLLELLAFAALYYPALTAPITGYIESSARTGSVASSGFFIGVFAAVIVQIVGYGLVWTGWWLSRRIGR